MHNKHSTQEYSKREIGTDWKQKKKLNRLKRVREWARGSTSCKLIQCSLSLSHSLTHSSTISLFHMPRSVRIYDFELPVFVVFLTLWVGTRMFVIVTSSININDLKSLCYNKNGKYKCNAKQQQRQRRHQQHQKNWSAKQRSENETQSEWVSCSSEPK